MAISSFQIEKVAMLLKIVAGIMFLAALVAYSQYFFGWPFGRIGNTPTLQRTTKTPARDDLHGEIMILRPG